MANIGINYKDPLMNGTFSILKYQNQLEEIVAKYNNEPQKQDSFIAFPVNKQLDTINAETLIEIKSLLKDLIMTEIDINKVQAGLLENSNKNQEAQVKIALDQSNSSKNESKLAFWLAIIAILVSALVGFYQVIDSNLTAAKMLKKLSSIQTEIRDINDKDLNEAKESLNRQIEIFKVLISNQSKKEKTK